MNQICFITTVKAAAALLVLTTAAFAAPQPTTPTSPTVLARKSPPIIIIKVDDLRRQNETVNPRWQRLVDFAKSRKLKTNIGIIADSLDGDHPAYFQWIKDQQATGLFEFWNHGFDHKQWTENGKTLQEFKGPPYEQQKEHMTRANLLARQKLGFSFAAFGAGFNATDETTVRVLRESPDIRVWLYGDKKNPADKIVMERVGAVNIENPIFHPSLQKFIEGYNRYPNQTYFVIQGHPQQWDETGFAQFVQIVDFLTGEKAVFMTPSEYAKTHG